MRNRLKLDWALTTSSERSSFINNYIQSETFSKIKPTSDELETMANYVLWGKDEDGLNSDQRKEIEMPRKYSTWAAQNIDSLDEKIDSPSFSEGTLQKLGTTPLTKKPKESFSREETRNTAPLSTLPLFEELWERIDYTELLINLYEEKTGKRKKPPRDELLQRFSEEKLQKIQEKAATLSQYKYLKLKHLLVELRREQYTLKDSYAEGICRRSYGEVNTGVELVEEVADVFRKLDVFEEEVPVLPLGVMEKKGSGFWREREDIIPENFGEEEILEFSKVFWEKEDIRERVEGASPSSEVKYFDFRDLEMVYQLLLEYQEMSRDSQVWLRNTSKLIQTLFYYVEEAHLTEIQEKILRLKMRRVKNQDIANQINGEYGKSYTANYISTIFRQKIIPEINGAAAIHAQIVSSLPFEEEFKRCTRCGRVLLRDPVNFVRKKRAKDGLSSRCKKCDKEERERNKR